MKKHGSWTVTVDAGRLENVVDIYVVVPSSIALVRMVLVTNEAREKLRPGKRRKVDYCCSVSTKCTQLLFTGKGCFSIEWDIQQS